MRLYSTTSNFMTLCLVEACVASMPLSRVIHERITVLRTGWPLTLPKCRQYRAAAVALLSARVATFFNCDSYWEDSGTYAPCAHAQLSRLFLQTSHPLLHLNSSWHDWNSMSLLQPIFSPRRLLDSFHTLFNDFPRLNLHVWAHYKVIFSPIRNTRAVIGIAEKAGGIFLFTLCLLYWEKVNTWLFFSRQGMPLRAVTVIGFFSLHTSIWISSIGQHRTCSFSPWSPEFQPSSLYHSNFVCCVMCLKRPFLPLEGGRNKYMVPWQSDINSESLDWGKVKVKEPFLGLAVMETFS